jgi:hypothetical protein
MKPTLAVSIRRSSRGVRVCMLFLGALAAGALVAACSSPPSLTAYQSQANTICHTYAQQLRTVYSDVALSSVRGNSQLASALGRDLPTIESGSGQLEGLAQPANDRAIKKAVSNEEAVVGALKTLQGALQHGDRSAAQHAANTVSEREAPLNLAFNLAGLTSCASGGGG